MASDEAKATYKELHAELDGFARSVSGQLGKAEQEFLQAYRSHMVEVHRELLELRSQLVAAEGSIQQDEHIRRLEEEMKWYRKEASYLHAYHSAMAKDKKFVLDKPLSITSTNRGGNAPVQTGQHQPSRCHACGVVIDPIATHTSFSSVL